MKPGLKLAKSSQFLPVLQNSLTFKVDTTVNKCRKKDQPIKLPHQWVFNPTYFEYINNWYIAYPECTCGWKGNYHYQYMYNVYNSWWVHAYETNHGALGINMFGAIKTVSDYAKEIGLKA